MTTIRDRLVASPEELIYDADERGRCYNCIRILWCGCFEPYAHITTKYVKEDRYEQCARISDSMAFENIRDVRRTQEICCLMGSYAPCCCCINDMGNIILYGSEASDATTNKNDDPWILKRISNSFQVYETITAHLQEIHADWRKTGRKLARKIHQVGGGTIGLSVGGAKDINSFRKCIKNKVMPSVESVTYNGLLYEYYFDTDTSNDDSKCVADESMLFYPTYCFAKTFNSSDTVFEYWMSVGLNSNIDQDDFERKNLNLIIILDRSGSMRSPFYNDSVPKSKMEVANESVIGLMKHLKPKDRFSFIAFDSVVETIQTLKFVKDLNMQTLSKQILSITAGGSNEFCDAYNQAIEDYDRLFQLNEYDTNSIEYENRIIFLTDAQIHIGCKDPNLLKYVRDDAEKREKNRIYTTFIGIGVDFYANLCEEISSTRGCNYYSVKSTKDFMEKMEKEFEYMVTPLVFNVSMKLMIEGNEYQIENVYGTNNDQKNDVLKTGEIITIHTLFAAPRSEDNDGTAGGIQIIKLKKPRKNKNIMNNSSNINIVVTFEDRNGKKYTNKQSVPFKEQQLINNINKNTNMDMIEMDDDEIKEEEKEMNFYDNVAIRKGIILCKYVELLRDWIEYETNKDKNTKTLRVSDKYKSIFFEFKKYFQREMIAINDDTMKKEVDLLQCLT